MSYQDINKEWIGRGNAGCAFAATFAKKPHVVNWVTIVNPKSLEIPKDAFMISIQFPDKDKEFVKSWALDNGFFIEDLGEGMEGLRYKNGNCVSWVQYFGFDSHCKTRQAPIPELLMCCKLPAHYYAKVGFNGVLHVAHASVKSLVKKATDILWDSSHTNTERILGHKPTKHEAAKTTFVNE